MPDANMQSVPVGTLPQQVRRDFSCVGYEDALQRAREIVPLLRERAAKSECARMLLRENEQLLHESGLFAKWHHCDAMPAWTSNKRVRGYGRFVTGDFSWCP
jgi:hypothetical protein